MNISKSYPFLSISRIYNVPYWAVLCYADWVEQQNYDYVNYKASLWQHEAGKYMPPDAKNFIECLNKIKEALKEHSRIK